MDNMRSNCKWMFGAIFLVALVLVGLRWLSSIQNKGPVFDEQYITKPINNSTTTVAICIVAVVVVVVV